MAQFLPKISTSSLGGSIPLGADRAWALTCPMGSRQFTLHGSPALIPPHVEFDLPLEALLGDDDLPELEAE